jgi:hypothetical protein
MCINFKTSIGAFAVGTIAGLILVTSGNKEKIAIGTFVIFYTFVQLCEALIYTNNLEIYSKLLLLNLGFHGLVFTILLNTITPIHKFFIYAFVFIAAFTLYKILQPDFKKATIEGGMKWNFKDNFTDVVLTIMYTLMFLVVYFYRNKFDIVNKFAILLLVLSLTSRLIMTLYPNLICGNNKPSIWCLASAVASPIMLYFK